MDYAQEVLDALNKSNEEVAAWKKRSESLTAELDSRLISIETKLGRPGVGRNGRPVETAELKAFNAFLRSGDDREMKSLSIGSNTDGGFAVPKEISTQIEALLLKQTAMRKIAKIERAGTSDYHKLVNKRGTAASWVSETAARNSSATPALAMITFPDGELTANPQITQRALDDIFFDAGAWLAGELADAFGASEGDAFINGTGVNQPFGLLSGPAPVATTDATRAFGTLQYIPSGGASAFAASNPADALWNTVYALKPGYRTQACWLMAPSTLNTVSQFKDNYGRYLLVPSIAVATPPTLLGYPVYEDENMPAVAANAFPIAFGNFERGYVIVDRWDLRILRDPFSSKPYVGFYSWKRVSGAPVNSEAIKLLKIATS